MIYTCTLNTAIDMFVHMNDFKPDYVNRSIYDEFQPNGKGVNISVILSKLGTPNIATGFVGGFSGKFVKDELEKMNIQTDFIEVEGNTRINVFLKSNQGEYKIVNSGPIIKKNEINSLLSKIKNLNSNDILFVSGSLPKGLDGEILLTIAKLSKSIGFKLIIDTSHPILKEIIKYKPFLIKPNEEELQNLFPDHDLNSDKDIAFVSNLLIKEGCQNVIVSVGGNGAYFFNKYCSYYCTAPKGEVINTAGAGDTILATYYHTFQETLDEATALKRAVAAGSSTAFKSGLTDFSDTEKLFKESQISTLNVTKQG
ncbi:1-phosphofructokinase [Mammaliicoccus sp. H-M34]|uniref:1-phosphofructokinase n=1 Tax=Mammaliicoccus sp. H-M34 TaxID=2898693 RepID=UPI001EFBD10F|nr:1-phosphofructokinase [Mammaliicoccus sp. H-M34]